MMEDLRLEDMLSPENTILLSPEERDQLAQGNELEQALSTFLLTDQPEPFFQVVTHYFGVTHLAPVVQEYMKATKQIRKMKGPLFLEGLAQSLKSPGTWKDWITNKWGDGVFPGIFIGSERYGTEFLLLLSTGHLLSIHHDSLQEVAWDLAEETSSREQFLEALITKGSAWSLPQLFQLQIALERLGLDSFMRMDDKTLEQVRTLVCSFQQWSASELEEASGELKGEFLQHLCRF